jgi:tetratricopeptide (TPR) repeat protein
MPDHAGDRLPEITTRFREFHDRHPNDPIAAVLYAKALIAALDPTGFPPEAEQAMQLLEQARKLDDNQPEIHYQLGCLLERKRDYQAAASELERSIALDPREPFAHFHLARVYERQGRKEEALHERDRHQKLTDSSPEAQIANLLDDLATSGRILEAGDLTDRLGTRHQLAPGRPPLLEFRYLEGAARHRFGTLDLVIDDAGH